MANTLAYTLHSIQDSFDHCDIGVAIPQFQTCDGAQLDSVNAVIVNAIQDIVDAFCWVESASDDTHLGPPKNGLGVDPIILTATPSLISVELYIATWRSGTCRNHYTRTINIDVEDSRELRMGEIFKNRTSAALFFSKYCERALKVHWEVAPLAQWQVDIGRMSASQSLGFRNRDMVFIFAPHSVGPHAIGRTLVDIPFDATHQFLTDRMIDLLACNDHEPDEGRATPQLNLTPIEG